jgi:hypothetical protein
MAIAVDAHDSPIVLIVAADGVDATKLAQCMCPGSLTTTLHSDMLLFALFHYFYLAIPKRARSVAWVD